MYNKRQSLKVVLRYTIIVLFERNNWSAPYPLTKNYSVLQAVFFRSPAPAAAILNLLPVLFPFFAPVKGALADGTYFNRQVFFIRGFHLSNAARNVSAFSRCLFLFSGLILSNVFSSIPSLGLLPKKSRCTCIKRQNRPSHISCQGPLSQSPILRR